MTKLGKPKIGYVGATMDLLHEGHINLLDRAKEMCDWLVVVLNTDDFVSRKKNRLPIHNLYTRYRVLKSLKQVDWVDINAMEEDSKPMLLKYKPDVIFVGDDYNIETYCKQMSFTKEWLKKHNMKVQFLPYTEGISTTEIINKIKKQK